MSGKRSFSGRIKQTALITLLLVLAAPSAALFADELTSEERELPVWVLMEKGKSRFRDGDFATAHSFFVHARNEGAVLPEAEYWMGRVYEEEGELELAVSQYRKALELARFLYISDDRIDISYRLADAYKKGGNWDLYEYQLQVLVDGEISRNKEILDREHLYVSTLKEGSLDELLYLYRLDYGYSLRAFLELGVFYYKEGRYRSATLNNLYAVMTFFSLGIEELIREDPEFQFPRTWEKLMEYDPDWFYDDLENRVRLVDGDFSFLRRGGSRELIDPAGQTDQAFAYLEEQGVPYYYSGVGYTLDLFRQTPALDTFLDDYNIYQALYYLACSLYAEGYQQGAADLWSILDSEPAAGSWSLLSSRQLASPHIDKSSSLF